MDGVIRASQYGYVYDGVEHSLQEGYDIDFKAPGVGSLGVVLRAHALPGVVIVPAAIIAMTKAQEHGFAYVRS